MLKHSRAVAGAACLIALAACRAAPATFDPQDPVAIAAIDSLIAGAMEGAANVDADRVLAMAVQDSTLTFLTGDVLLTGFEPIREQFRKTYSNLQRQQQTIIEKHVRLLSPDVALVTAVAEGTYTDKAGWTSPPVGIGTTIIFVREDGEWRAQHVHQSIAY